MFLYMSGGGGGQNLKHTDMCVCMEVHRCVCMHEGYTDMRVCIIKACACVYVSKHVHMCMHVCSILSFGGIVWFVSKRSETWHIRSCK